MSLDSHIKELEAKHHALEAKIEQELAHPAPDDLAIAELKRQKLRIKDELTRLAAEAAA